MLVADSNIIQSPGAILEVHEEEIWDVLGSSRPKTQYHFNIEEFPDGSNEMRKEIAMKTQTPQGCGV